MNLVVLNEVLRCSLSISVIVVDPERDAPLGALVGCSPRASEGFGEAFQGSKNRSPTPVNPNAWAPNKRFHYTNPLRILVLGYLKIAVAYESDSVP